MVEQGFRIEHQALIIIDDSEDYVCLLCQGTVYLKIEATFE